MTKVKSSNIEGVDYDPKKRVLIVHFTSGTHYQYSGVPQSRYSGLLRAKSKGRYFAKWIKPAHKYRKIEEG